jgi:hypothetical protein
VHEQRRSPGRTQGGCNLARNDAALAHARDHHPPGTGVDQKDCGIEGRSHRAPDAVGQSAQSLSLDPDYIFANAFHGGKQMLAEPGSQQLALGN